MLCDCICRMLLSIQATLHTTGILSLIPQGTMQIPIPLDQMFNHSTIHRYDYTDAA